MNLKMSPMVRKILLALIMLMAAWGIATGELKDDSGSLSGRAPAIETRQAA